MSILIKGIEMPKSCWDCFACHEGWCIINQKIEGHRTVTHSCPLVEVPKHGRLIDADALKTYHGWYNEDKEHNVVQSHIQFVYANDIINAPTIIESEGE